MAQGTDNQILLENGYRYLSKQDNEWIPYVGPDGGEGWQRVGDDEVRYQQHPPGDVAEGVDRDYWNQAEAGWAELTHFLEDRDKETFSELYDRVQQASEITGEEVGDLSAFLLGRFQHREAKFGNDFSEATDEQLLGLVDSLLSNREEEVEHRESLDELGELVEDHPELDTRTKLDISEAVREIQENTDLTEEELRQDLYELVSQEGVNPRYALDNVGLNDWVEEQTAEWRAENFEGQDAIELPEGFDRDDIEDGDVYDALKGTSLSMFEVNIGPDDSPIEAVANALEDEYADDPNRLYDEVQGFNEALEEVLVPFSQTDTSAPDHLSPKNAERVYSLDEVTDKTGRSASSMFVAQGVPDEDGNKRPLFITNTNPSRQNARSQRDEDAARQLLGSAGFQAAGYDAPDSYHEPGEFWVVEGAPGDTADEYHVEQDLDDPIQQFADLGAAAFVLGAWDVHEGNVFIHDGEFIPVDMDLAGAALHDNADFNQNRYRADQDGLMGTFPRLERLFNRMDGGDSIEFDDIREAVKRRVEEMGESGEAREIAEAAKQSMSNQRLRSNVEANARSMENHSFFDEYPKDVEDFDSVAEDPDSPYQDIQDLDQGQVIEMVGEERGNVWTQRFRIINDDAIPNRLEIQAVDDGERFNEGQTTFTSSIDNVIDVFEETDVESLEDVTDLEEGQVVEFTEQDRNPRSQEFEVTEVYDDEIEITALEDGSILGEGERWNVSDLDAITDIIDTGEEEQEEPEQSDVIQQLEDELDAVLEGGQE